ncbi:DUF1194 domain-containing protein [Nitrosococcus watsonii]|uniref:VWFA domain-containing protein n=1 Tax=Nitrosococcus watsoni (strain C-113) TaxID=105559 RepID=D8K723_NITWC|nr:DUF1194 domain-containing protein [Nitrosococcus watsonii]ADJ28700.1 protein of unknown function DUF1194 [Nitrosococcus watsonii C-113]
MSYKNKKAGRLMVMAAAAILTPGLASAIPVDLELSLVIDVSGSVNTSEYNLQMDGYANAFRDSSIQNNILGGSEGSIAVNTIFFSSSAFTTILDDFVLLDSNTTINDYAQQLDDFTRPGSGSTDIQDGMNKALTLLTGDNGFESSNLLMDVSGDGISSISATESARDAAAAAGITVNGLPIGDQGITDFYTDHVITSNGLITAAADFDNFSQAIRQKLQIETGGPTTVSEPTTLVLFGAGLLGLVGYRRCYRNV